MIQASPVFAQTPLGFSKVFSPATVDPGEISRLTFTIDNSANAIAVGSIAFNDAFPFGLSGGGNVNNGCGGRVSASVGSGGVSLSGGTVAARQTCTSPNSPI